jgi:hypothetical protein
MRRLAAEMTVLSSTTGHGDSWVGESLWSGSGSLFLSLNCPGFEHKRSWAGDKIDIRLRFKWSQPAE